MKRFLSLGYRKYRLFLSNEKKVLPGSPPENTPPPHTHMHPSRRVDHDLPRSAIVCLQMAVEGAAHAAAFSGAVAVPRGSEIRMGLEGASLHESRLQSSFVDRNRGRASLWLPIHSRLRPFPSPAGARLHPGTSFSNCTT